MIAMDRGRKLALGLVAASALGIVPALTARAQQGQKPGRAATAPAPQQQPKGIPAGAKLQEVAVPTNPTDAIALVNGEPITRQQLADECVARKGQEILETLIARRLIEQALRAKKLEVTAAEIDEEIDRVAQQTAGMDRDLWLRTLDKERGISPAQYARDIIYPGLALRKLAGPRVKITEQDLKAAFEANHGARLRCRIIMVGDIHKATQTWEELRKNPERFEKIAKERSMDTSTRALGGMLPEPITRHANPKPVSDAAFTQLVDGDPKETNPARKPKDGDISGPIQVNENAWLIMKREELVAGPSGSYNDPLVRARLEAQMFEVKLNEAMEAVFREIHDASSIDNKLNGFVRAANEEQHPDYIGSLDEKVRRMSVAGETQSKAPSAARTTGPAGPTSPANAPVTPAGVPAGAVGAANKLKDAIRSAPPGTVPPGN